MRLLGRENNKCANYDIIFGSMTETESFESIAVVWLDFVDLLSVREQIFGYLDIHIDIILTFSMCFSNW